MTDVEIKLLGAAAILDGGISLPLKTIFGKIRVTMKVPTMAALVRMSVLFEKAGFETSDTSEFTMQQKFDFMNRYSKPISKMVTCGILRSSLMYGLFGSLLAWFIRESMHPVSMLEAWKHIMSSINTAPFEYIMQLAKMINKLEPMQPTEEKRS